MNMKLPRLAGLLLAIFAISVLACKKPTPFGSELLENGYDNLVFTDTITVQCTLEREDSVATSDKTATSTYLLCGNINDPVFGKYGAQIYTLLQPNTLNPQFDTAQITYDSVVLYLAYEPSGFYGDTLLPQSLQVYRLAEDMPYDSTYYSVASFQTGEEIGHLDNFYPKPNRTDSLYDGNRGAFLRIPLSDDFGRALLNIDSLTWLSDSSFYHWIHGLKITSTPVGDPGTLLAFNLNSTTFSRVSLYYTVKNDTAQSRFDFFFRNTNKFNHFDQGPDYANSEAGSHVNQVLTDKMYTQGMQGYRIKVSFPYANLFDRIAVNKAQLVLTAADNNPLLRPAEQLILTEFQGDSTYVFTSDALYALGASQTGSLSGFGGFPEKEIVNGTVVTRYRLALSDKFQQIVDDDASPDIKHRTVYINVYPRTRSAQRAVLYGPQSATFPAKLELKYTRVQ